MLAKLVGTAGSVCLGSSVRYRSPVWGSCECNRILVLEKLHVLQKPTEEAQEGKFLHSAKSLHLALLTKLSIVTAGNPKH